MVKKCIFVNTINMHLTFYYTDDGYNSKLAKKKNIRRYECDSIKMAGETYLLNTTLCCMGLFVIMMCLPGESREAAKVPACIQFPLHRELSLDLVTSAKLWIPNLVFSLSLLNHSLIGSPQLNNTSQNNWHTIELKHILEETFSAKHNHIELALNFPLPSPKTIGLFSWFLQLEVDGKSHIRKRRNAEYCNSYNGGCCREKLHVDFNSIGWGDWIIYPKSFSTNYCKGSCQGNFL